jgi:hypothetical protein
MAEDESFLALRTRGAGFQLVELVRRDGNFDYLLHFETLAKQKAGGAERTYQIDSVRTREAGRIFCEHIRSFIDPLHGTSFDVELLVAKTFSPFHPHLAPTPH